MIELSFKDLYDTYAGMVYNLALQYTANAEDAEEITQDVFVKVHSQLSRFRKEAQPKTWIYRIAVNTSLDYLKARQARKRSGFLKILRFDDNAVSHPVEVNHPGIQLENKEALEGLFTALHKLPPNQQTVLILLKIDGLSQAEASAIMQISQKALESLLQRAKQNLVQLLKAKENE